MSKYRINVRFDLDKPKDAKAVQYLQSLDKSRNAFIVTAVINEIQRQTSVSNFLLEDIRQVNGAFRAKLKIVQKGHEVPSGFCTLFSVLLAQF